MLDITYLYHLPTADIPVTGFIAYLLQLGDAWDIRCLEADMHDYHAQQYARMNPIIIYGRNGFVFCHNLKG